MGPARILSNTEEIIIKNWIVEMARAGFPVTMEQVTFSVQCILNKLKRPNPFKENRPGKSWMKGFMKNYPEIAVRMSQNLTRTRAGITKENLLKWFSEVQTYLTQSAHMDILQDPKRVFNTNETAFFLNPKGGKVLAKKGSIFRNSNQSKELREMDMSLFELWQNTKQELESMSAGALNAPDLIHDESVNRSFEDVDINNSTSEIANHSFEAVSNLQTDTPSLVSIDEPPPDPCQSGPSSVSTNVPSPFKRHLFYRKDIQEPQKKRVVKEKMPAIVSGLLCQEYFQRRLLKKEEIARAKLERVAERARKREEKDKERKKNKSKRVLRFDELDSDSSIDVPSDIVDSNDESDTEDTEIHQNNPKKPVERKMGEYVVFSYEKELFPGVIMGVSEMAATISAMQKSGRLWKWPERMDKLDYEWEAVLSHINEPVKMSTTRNVYSVPELDFLWK